MASNDSEIKIKVGFEPGEVPPEVFERIQEMAGGFAKEFVGSSDALRTMRTEAHGVAEEMNNVLNVATRLGNEQQAGNVADAFGSMEQAEMFTRLGQKADGLTQELNVLGAEVTETWKKFVAGEVPATQMETLLQKGTETLREYGKAHQELAEEISGGQRGLVAIDTSSYEQCKLQMQGVSAAILEAKNNMPGLQERAEDVSTAVRSIFKAADELGNKELKHKLIDMFGGREFVQTIARAPQEVQRLDHACEGIVKRMREVAAAVEDGSMNASEGLEKFNALERALEHFQGVGGVVEQAFGKLKKAADITDVMEQLTEAGAAIEQQQEAITAVLKPLQENTQAWRVYQAALDETSDSYAENNAAAQQAIAQNMALESALKGQKKALEAQKDELAETAKAYDGSANAAKDAAQAAETHKEKTQAIAQSIEALTARANAAYARRAAAAKSAADKEAKAAAEAAAAQERMEYAMKLSTMSKRELIEESNRLTEALKAEAEAGTNGENYARLQQQLIAVRHALTDCNKVATLTRMKWMQSAQTAQGLAHSVGTLVQGFSGMADAAHKGELNLTGMVASVMQLGMAMQAGLGPLGWTLAAVEGLQMAWNAYARSQQEAMRKSEEAAKQNAEALRQYIEMQKGLLGEDATKGLDKQLDALHTTAEAQRGLLAQEMDDKERAAQHRIALARETAQQEIEALTRSYNNGEITATELEAGKQAAKARLAQVEESARKESETRRKETLEGAKQTADEELDLIRKKAAEHKEAWQMVLDANLPDDRELLTLKQEVAAIKKERDESNKRLEKLKSEFVGLRDPLTGRLSNEDVELQKQMNAERKKRAAIEAQLSAKTGELNDKQQEYYDATEEAYDAVKDMPIFAGMQRKEVIKEIRKRQAENEQLDKKVTAAERAVTASEHAIKAAEENAKNTDELADLQKQRLDAANEDAMLAAQQKDAAKKAADAAKERARALEDAEYAGDLEEQARLLREELQYVEDGSDAARSIAKKLQTVEKHITDKAFSRALEAAQEAGNLQEQARILQEMLQAEKEGSDAAHDIAKQLRDVEKQAADAKRQEFDKALADLTAATQTSTSYTLEDNRHKTEILRDDMRILRERERELRALLAQADDEETRAKITDALADTLMQQRAVAAASARQAEEARKSIQAFSMPDLGVKKGLGGAGAAARRLQKLYERELERAQKALDKGDMAAYERSMKRLANSARALERVTDDPAAVKAMQEANRDALETQRNAGKTADAQRTMAQNAKRSEDAQKQLADDLSAAAQNAKQVKDRSQQLANQVMPDLQAAAPAMQQLTVQMSTLLTAANTLGNALAAFNGNMATLGNLMEQAAANATAVGNAADGAIRRVAGRVGACEKAIDRLNRKL